MGLQAFLQLVLSAGTKNPMFRRFKYSSQLSAALLFCGLAAADTQQTQATAAHPTPHHVHKAIKKTLPPLPNGPRGPVPQVPLDALPAVAPEVTFQNGLLTIVAPNSTLGDILRGVRKKTSADIEIPGNANDRVATRLGPAPPREVMADLLNGSHFNYILLGSPENVNALVRVVLVAKTGPDNPDSTTQANATPTPVTAKPAEDGDASAMGAEESVDEAADQAATEADQTPPDEPGVKTPQQMLQEMQQRQLQMQQQLQQNSNNNDNNNDNNNGTVTPPPRPPNMAVPFRPPATQPQPQQQDPQ